METEKLKKIIKAIDRYKDFTLLEKPIKFKDMQAGNNIKVVQLHSLEPCGDDDIVGFCGVFSWINNVLTPLDHDCYSKEMLVYGYSWFEDKNGDKCLDVLVKDW